MNFPRKILFCDRFFTFLRNCGNGVFKNQNVLPTDIHHHRKFVETFDSAGKRRAVQQVNDDIKPLAPRRIKKRILYVLGNRFFHNALSKVLIVDIAKMSL